MKKYLMLVLVLICIMCASCQLKENDGTYMERSSEVAYDQSSDDQSSDDQSSDDQSSHDQSSDDQSSHDQSSEKVGKIITDSPIYVLNKNDWSVFEQDKRLYSINQFGDFKKKPDLFFLDVITCIRDEYSLEDYFTSEVYIYNNLVIYVSDFDYTVDGKITNEKHITTLVWRYNNNLFTKRGITIGSSEEDVHKAYGDGLVNNFNFNGEDAHVIYFGEKEDTACSDYSAGIEFRIQYDKVVQISIYKDPKNIIEFNFDDGDYWIKP